MLLVLEEERVIQRDCSPLANETSESSSNEAILGRNGSLEPKGLSMMVCPNMASVLQRPRSNRHRSTLSIHGRQGKVNEVVVEIKC